MADSVSWRGTPGEYIVLCSYYLHTLGSLLNCEYHVNATSNSTVLQRLDTAKSYLVYMKMCNEEKMCSPDGEPYIVKILQGGLTMYVCVCVGVGGRPRVGGGGLSSCMSVKKLTHPNFTLNTCQ